MAADVQVKVNVLKEVPVESPLVESSSNVVVLQNGRKLENAIRGVVEKSVSLIMDKLALSFEDAFRLTSIAGDLRICQACASSLDVVVRMQLPKLFSLR